MRQFRLADMLRSQEETVRVGLSAGSMVLTPRIGREFVQWESPTGDEGLGFALSRSARTSTVVADRAGKDPAGLVQVGEMVIR